MNATAAPAISVKGLTKIYGDHRAVDDLDLEIRTGEVFAMLGPNGAGKTTTVEILEGFRHRDGGEVRVLDTDPQRANLQWRNRIGVVLQTSSGLDLITPREALRHTARAYASPRDVDEVVDAVGLAEKADDRVAALSGGQRRRLDVGLGIFGRPEVLFLDEPTTGFDPQARRDFWGLIERLAAEGTTIVLTTHYLDEAEQLADRVAVIAAGRLLALDTPAGLGGRDRTEAIVSSDDGGTRRTLQTAAPMDGIEATERLLGTPATAHVQVLVLTTYDTDTDIVRAVEAGARGYLLKDAPPQLLAAAIRSAAAGETVLAPTVAASLADHLRTPAPVALTDRELQVLRLVATGRSNAEIGRELLIGEATVKTYLLRAYAKLGVNDRTAAVMTAHRRGLIDPR